MNHLQLQENNVWVCPACYTVVQTEIQPNGRGGFRIMVACKCDHHEAIMSKENMLMGGIDYVIENLGAHARIPYRKINCSMAVRIFADALEKEVMN